MGSRAAFTLGIGGGILIILVDAVHLIATQLYPADAYIEQIAWFLRLTFGFIAGAGGFIVIAGSLLLLSHETKGSRSTVKVGAWMGFLSFLVLVPVYALSGAVAVQWAIVVEFIPLGLLGVLLSYFAQKKAEDSAG